MDYAGAYEILFNNRYTLVGETLDDIKRDFNQFTAHGIGNEFHRLVKENYLKVEKIDLANYKVLKVLK